MKVCSYRFIECKAYVSQVYVPAIIGYVPDEIVTCLSAFLDTCYISRQQDINTDTLDALDTALAKFWQLCEIFQTFGVWPMGFSLPSQHTLFHYCHHIQDFGAPGGLCSSITKSCHITAMKKPWQCSNRYQALGQMLKTIQCLDKLAAMFSDFIAHSMLLAGHAPGRNVSHLPVNLQGGTNNADAEYNDKGSVEEENVNGHVSLAYTCGKSISLTKWQSLIVSRAQLSTGPRQPLSSHRWTRFNSYNKRLPCNIDWHKHRGSASHWCCGCLPLSSHNIFCSQQHKQHLWYATWAHPLNPLMVRRCTMLQLCLHCRGRRKDWDEWVECGMNSLILLSWIQRGLISLHACRMVSEDGPWSHNRNVGCMPWSYAWETGQNSHTSGLFPLCSIPDPCVWQSENSSRLWSQLLFRCFRGILCE